MPHTNTRSDSYEALMWDVICNAHGYVPKVGDRVLDLGAHFGMFSLYCASRGAEVTAYEPNPAAFAELLHSAEVARAIGNGTISPLNLAVCGTPGNAMLFQRAESSGTASLLGNAGSQELGFVKCVTLHEAIGNETWDCVKVDIEGAEYDLFRKADQSVIDFGDWSRAIRFLTIEIHNDILSREQRKWLVKMLRDAFHWRAIPVMVDGKPTEDIATLFCWRGEHENVMG